MEEQSALNLTQTNLGNSFLVQVYCFLESHVLFHLKCNFDQQCYSKIWVYLVHNINKFNKNNHMLHFAHLFSHINSKSINNERSYIRIRSRKTQFDLILICFCLDQYPIAKQHFQCIIDNRQLRKYFTTQMINNIVFEHILPSQLKSKLDLLFLKNIF